MVEPASPRTAEQDLLDLSALSVPDNTQVIVPEDPQRVPNNVQIGPDNAHGVLVPTKGNQRLRKCCGWVLLCLWLGIGVLGGWAIGWGDVQTLRTGRDGYGNSCGLGKLREKPMTYFPDPLKSMQVAFCVTGCPQVSIPEEIRTYDPDLGTSEEDIWYDSYPSRPFYSYCVPAQALLRLPVQSLLFSASFSHTFVLRDILEGKEALAIAAIGVLVLTSLFLALFHIKDCPKWVYVGSNYLLIAEIGYLSYGLYVEAERQVASLCENYSFVQMQSCSLPVEDYRELFKACVVVFWTVLAVATQLSKSKKEGLERFKDIKKCQKGFLACLIVLFLGSGVYIALTACILALSSIGTAIPQDSDFEYPIQTWEYDSTLRCFVAIWCVLTGTCTLSWLSHIVLFVTGMDATETRRSQIKQSWRSVGVNLVWASIAMPLYRFISTVPGCLYTYWTKTSPPIPKAAISFFDTPFDFTFPKSNNTDVTFPRDIAVEKGQWRAAGEVEKLLWTLEVSIVLLGPALVHAWLRGWDVAISSYLALELVIIPYSYFLSQLLCNYLRGATYSSFPQANPDVISAPMEPILKVGVPVPAVKRINAVPG